MKKRIITLFYLFILIFSSFTLPVISDEELPEDNTIEPFIYWYAPENSFGISSTKNVNWSFFDSCFTFEKFFNNESSDYEFEIEYLEVNSNLRKYKYKLKTDDSGYYGLNIVFNPKVDDYTFFESNYSFIVHYKDGDIVYNFTDIVDTFGGDINCFVVDGVFHLELGKYLEEDVEFEIDPTFGFTQGEGPNEYSCEDQKIGAVYYLSETGTIDEITGYLVRSNYDGEFCYVIYRYTDHTFAGNTDSINYTDNTGENWVTLNMNGVIALDAGYYILMGWGEGDGSGDISIEYQDGASENFIRYNEVFDYGSPDSPDVPDQNSSGYNVSIYANYTVGGAENSVPTSSSEAPTNNTDCVSWVGGGITTYAVVTDTDSDDMNMTWWSNSTNGWKQYGIANTSVASGTNISQLNVNFSVDDTWYHWWLLGNDGMGGSFNDSYSFKICSNVTPPLPKDTPPSIETNFSNGSYENPIGLNFSNVWFNDSEGDIVNNWMNCSNGQFWSVNNSNVTGYIILSGLSYFTKYWVNCSSSDANNNTLVNYWFYTKNSTPPAFVNNITNASFPVPTNNSIDISPQPICNVTITDQDGNSSTCNFYRSSNGIDWIWAQINVSILNESISFNYTLANVNNTLYYWMVTCNDGNDNVSYWYSFTTVVGDELPYYTKEESDERYIMSGNVILEIESELLFFIILLMLWIFFLTGYIENRSKTNHKMFAITQFGFMLPLEIILASISFEYPFGFIIVFLIPILSLYILADSLYYKDKDKEK